MGSDRYLESRFLAEDNFWPARGILVRTARWLREQSTINEAGMGLLQEIEALLKRTEQK